MTDYFDPKFGAIVPIPFGVANGVTNKTNEDLAGPGADANTLVLMPKSGSIVGISVQASAAVTAGTVTFRAHKDGTEFPQSGYPAPVLNATNGNESHASIRPGALTFAAGDALGVSYTSSTDAAPTDSNDYGAILWVQLDPN